MWIGEKLQTGDLRGEATDQSARFYQRQFRDYGIQDEFRLSAAEQLIFLGKIRAKWRSTGLDFEEKSLWENLEEKGSPVNKKQPTITIPKDETASAVFGGYTNENSFAPSSFSEVSAQPYGAMDKGEQASPSSSRPPGRTSVYLGWDFDDDTMVLIGSRFRGSRPSRRRRFAPSEA